VEVIIDQDTGRVYVKREATPPGVDAQRTHQYRKFGVTLVWDGSGNLLGVEFESNEIEVPTVRSISSEEPNLLGPVTDAVLQ
jgi:hypothetical protein